MSNDKKPDRAISFVKFRGPVDCGPQAIEQWSAMNAVNSSAYGHGKTSIRDEGPCLILTYVAGDIDQEIEIPKANVAQVTRVKKEFLEAKLKAAGVKP